jgi:hypothetical protein
VTEETKRYFRKLHDSLIKKHQIESYKWINPLEVLIFQRQDLLVDSQLSSEEIQRITQDFEREYDQIQRAQVEESLVQIEKGCQVPALSCQPAQESQGASEPPLGFYRSRTSVGQQSEFYDDAKSTRTAAKKVDDRFKYQKI